MIREEEEEWCGSWLLEIFMLVECYFGQKVFNAILGQEFLELFWAKQTLVRR